MRNVLFIALIVAVASTAWAQAPDAKPAPAAPAAQSRAAAQAAPAAPTPATPPARAGAAQVVPLLPPFQPAPATVAAVQRSGPAAPRNIRFDIVITETGGPKPTTKTISLSVIDSNGSGSVRNVTKPGVSLNVDVRAVYAFEGGAVRASVNVEYQPDTPDASSPSSGIQSSITSMFQDGRRTQILQTSDPISDRRTTIDVTATLLK